MIDRDPDDRGLEASPAFVQYMVDLRKRWPRNEELAAKYGVSAENGQFDFIDMSETTTDETDAQLYDTIGRRRFIQGAAATAALAATGSAAAQEDSESLELDYSSQYVANPYIAADVTIGTHKPDHSNPLMYEDDNGNDVELAAEIDDTHPDDADETTANLYGVRADRVATDAYSAFPRDAQYDESGDGDSETAVTAVDATHWSTNESNTSGSLTVDDGGDEVESVRFEADSLSSGDNATATFDLTEHDAAITGDEDKRYLQLVVNVDALTSGAVVEIRAVDDDGDYKAGVIDPTADSASTSTIATATGSGIVYQVQLADLSVEGSGAGTFNNIESIEVDVAEADATIELFGIDLERKSEWVFGEHVDAENTDDEETTTVSEPSGYTTLTDLSGSLLADAEINDLQVPIKYTAGASEVGSATSTAAENYPSFDERLEQVERLSTETAIDLSHSNLVLELDQALPSERYHAVELATGTENTDDPEDMSWSDVAGSLSGPETTATLEDLVEGGTEYAVRIRTVLTSDEFSSSTSSSGSLFGGGGGGGGSRGSGGGGFFSGARGAVLAIAGAGTAYFGFVRKRLLG